jgi:putative membrane fusion protein
LALQGLLKFIAWRLLEVERVNDGVLHEKLAMQVYIARQEEVIIAPAAGKLLPLVTEGERVPEGATIARLLLPLAIAPDKTEAIDLKAPFAGQVSYKSDGLEKVLRPGNLEYINLQELTELAGLATLVTAGGQVKTGMAIIRLVNNLEPLGLYAVVDEWPPGWQQGKVVTLELPGQQVQLKASITGRQDAGDSKVVIMEVPNWDSRWLHPRQVEVNAILNNYRGVIVPVKSLSTRPGGEKGVYLYDTKELKWQAVTCLGQVGDRVAIDGIKAGSEVVTNPHLARWLVAQED